MFIMRKMQEANIYGREESTVRVVLGQVEVRVSFPCRLFMEYTLEGKVQRTAEVRVDPKHWLYPYHQEIVWRQGS
jgi:hypothetical protein